MGDEKRYYWLKLKDDFFNSRKMKKLRKVAGGDTYTIIYLKLQLLSINNEGVIEFEGTDEDIFHQLALDIDEEVDDIKMTVAFCRSNDLIEFEEQDLVLNEVPELIGSETQAARRMRRKRAKDKKAIESSNNNNIVQSSSNIDTDKRNFVRDRYTDIDIDKEIDIDIDKDRDNIGDYDVLVVDKSKDSLVKDFYYKAVKANNDRSDESILDEALAKYGWQEVFWMMASLKEDQKAVINSFRYVDTALARNHARYLKDRSSYDWWAAKRLDEWMKAGLDG